MNDLTDHERLHRWRDGDGDAGSELVERHSEALRRFFANKVPDAAEDLSQQTLLAALESADRYDPSRSFRSYVLGIANNVLLMHVRKRYRGERAGERSYMTSEGLSPSPSRVVAQRQEIAVLLQVLRTIPLERQVLLELYYWEGLSVSDIATTLELEPGTVKSRLFRARAQLRRRMDAFVPSDVATEEFGPWDEAVRDGLEKV